MADSGTGTDAGGSPATKNGGGRATGTDGEVVPTGGKVYAGTEWHCLLYTSYSNLLITVYGVIYPCIHKNNYL